LRTQELNGVGQPGGGKNFFVDARQDFLRGEIGREALAQDPKEVGLFDIFFSVQCARRHHDLDDNARRIRRERTLEYSLRSLAVHVGREKFAQDALRCGAGLWVFPGNPRDGSSALPEPGSSALVGASRFTSKV